MYGLYFVKLPHILCTSKFFRATCGNDPTAMTFNFPPTMEGASSHKSQVTVNDSFSHVKS